MSKSGKPFNQPLNNFDLNSQCLAKVHVAIFYMKKENIMSSGLTNY